MHALLNPWSTYLDPMPWLTNPFAFAMTATETRQQSPSITGTFVREQFDSDAGSIAYKLYIPAAYSGAPLPLLVMLHGCGQDADDFATGTDMNALAEEMACIVVYPEQSTRANSARCWHWFDEAHHHRDQGEPALLAGVTRKIMTEYAVDAGRVFVAGLSAGGAMAVVLGRTYPELFTAVGCHSGLAYACATDMSAALQAMREGPQPGGNPEFAAEQVPVIVFHGDQDGTVHPRNGACVVEQCLVASESGESGTVPIPLLAERGETTGRAFTRQVYQDQEGQVLAEQWLVHGTGHAWSGGSRRGSYTDASGPNASAEMLRFFLSMRQAASALA